MRAPSATVAAIESRMSLWRSILLAQASALPLPRGGRTGKSAALFAGFQAHLQVTERKALSFRRRIAKERRARDPALLFRDLKEERAAPVETLVEGPDVVEESPIAFGA